MKHYMAIVRDHFGKFAAFLTATSWRLNSRKAFPNNSANRMRSTKNIKIPICIVVSCPSDQEGGLDGR